MIIDGTFVVPGYVLPARMCHEAPCPHGNSRCHHLIAGLCPGCNREMHSGQLVVSTVLDTRHSACATPAMMAMSVCPDCGEPHDVSTPERLNGACLL